MRETVILFAVSALGTVPEALEKILVWLGLLGFMAYQPL